MRKERRMKGMARRTGAALLTVVMLTITVAGDCIIPPVPVSATGLEADILLAIIEAAMASMGLSFSSTTDLNNAANALQYGMDNDYQYAVQGTDMFAGLKEGLKSSTAEKLILPGVVWGGLCDFLYNMSAGELSKASDVVNTENASIFGQNVECVSGFNSAEDVLWGNNKALEYNKSTGKYDIPTNYNFSDLNSRDIVITSLLENMNVTASVTTDVLKDASYFYVFNNGQLRAYSISGSYFTDSIFCINFIKYQDNTSSYAFRPAYGYVLGPDVKYNFVFAFSSSILNGNALRHKAYIKPGVKIYPSREAGLMMEGSLALYKPQSKVYGLSSSAGSKSVAKNDDGTVTLSNLQTGITQAVQQAVDAALANNPAITEEQMNAIVAQVIASNEGIKDEISDDITEQTGILTGLLTAIKLAVDGNALGINGIAADIANLQESINDMSITDGTGALQLQEDVADIKDQFKVIEGGGGSSGNNDNEPHEPKVWVPGTFKVPAFLSGLVAFLTTPFLIMTDGIRQIWLNISSLPDSISASFKDWLEPLLRGLGFANGIEILPGQEFKDWLEPLLRGLGFANGIEILPGQEFKDWLEPLLRGLGFANGIEILPGQGFKDWLEPLLRGLGFANGIEILPGQEFKDWLEPLLRGLGLANGLTLPQLDTISGILEDAFVIDTAAIADAAGGLEDVWGDIFPIDAITDTFDGLNFSDNYSYPVIKMPVPDILEKYYESEYIIFLDFGGDMFRKYCLWVRSLVKAFIWFRFALQILSKFKVSFHVA